MAIYHLNIKIFSRGKGKSAVGAAAYRAGEKILNEYDGVIHDYTRKGGVVHTEILLPDNAPAEYADRAILWNAVEKIEKAKNSQLAREIELALPVELTREHSISLVREYVNQHFVSAGMCADIAIHDTGSGNPHAHVMLTMRPFNEDKTWGSKQKKVYILDGNGDKIYDPKKRQYKCNKVQTTDWNEQTRAEEWRQGWADVVNRYLVLYSGTHIKVDHRSYERQGIDQIPTIHLGVAASQMEKKGIRTERGDINRQIAVDNQQLRQLRARIRKLQKWIAEEATHAAPNLQTIIKDILDGGNDRTHWQKLRDLKTAAKVLAFLQSNEIFDIEQLRDKVRDMYGHQQDMSRALNKADRRLKTLDEHIMQADIYLKHKGVHRQYREQKPKKQAAFYEKHSSEIMLYQSAKKYLDEHLNGRTSIPTKAWKAERSKLLAERAGMNQQYALAKEEVRNVEVIRKYAEEAARLIAPDVKRDRTKGMEL